MLCERQAFSYDTARVSNGCRLAAIDVISDIDGPNYSEKTVYAMKDLPNNTSGLFGIFRLLHDNGFVTHSTRRIGTGTQFVPHLLGASNYSLRTYLSRWVGNSTDLPCS